MYENYGMVPPISPQEQEQRETKKTSKAAGFFKKVFLCVCLGMIFGLCAGVGFYVVRQAVVEKTQQQEAQKAAAQEPDVSAENENKLSQAQQEEAQVTGVNHVSMVYKDLTEVVNEVMPSMVSIGNEFQEKYSYFGQTFAEDRKAAGSGIIVGKNDTELLVVTNYHVVEKAEKLTVTFIDNEEAQAQLKGSDPSMDLAVLAVPLSDMKRSTLNAVSVAKLGNSDHLNLGEPVIAIGNALGYGQSVTSGIVSAVNREVTQENGVTGTFVQTDAAINPGNSGGALLDLNGEVVGINSNKSGGDIVEGMGYAIPISAAKPIIAELMLKETKTKVAEGEVGYIGIQPATVTDEISRMYGMPKGVYVTQVIEDAPAAKAGLEKGDIITAIDGNTITSYEDLQEEMQYHGAGSDVEITIQRTGPAGYEEMKFTITLGNRDN